MEEPRSAGGGATSDALSVRGVSKRFGEEPVLDEVTFSIAEGQSLVLLGHSGSGKTTILRLIAGLEKPDRGEIYLRGRRVDPLRARDRNIGVIFQHYALFPGMTVVENIGFGLRIRGVKRAEWVKVALGLLELVGLSEQREKYPAQLSGGQQQRVAIARALAYQPAMLLFDESFSALDPQTRGGLRREIRRLLQRLRIPALFITHDQEEAMELGDQVAILNQGRVEQIGTPREIYEHPRTEFVATFLGAANVLTGQWEQGHVLLAGDRQLSVEGASSARAWHTGQPLKVVFRPEDVLLGAADRPGEEREAGLSLGLGEVLEVTFSGASEWLVIGLAPGERVDAQPGAGSEDGLERPVRIKVFRTKWEAQTLRLAPGDRVSIGLKAVQLLVD